MSNLHMSLGNLVPNQRFQKWVFEDLKQLVGNTVNNQKFILDSSNRSGTIQFLFGIKLLKQ